MTGMEPSANHFERQQTIQKDTTGRAEKEDFLCERGRFSYHHRKSYFSAAWAVGGDENETVLTYSPFAKGNIESGCGSLWQFHYKFIFLFSCFLLDSLSSSYIMQSLIISRALISSVLTHQSIRVVSQNTKISSSHDLAFRTHSLAEVKWVLRKLITHFRSVDIWLGDLYRAMSVSMSTIHNNNDWGNGIS